MIAERSVIGFFMNENDMRFESNEPHIVWIRKLNCESVSEVIMRTWVKNSVRITVHGPRFPIDKIIWIGLYSP